MEETREFDVSCHRGISPDRVVPLITSALSAADAGARLEKTYANKSRTRVMRLKSNVGKDGQRHHVNCWIHANNQEHLRRFHL